MLREQLPRLAVIGLCLVFLGGLFVLAGSGWPEDPEAGPGLDIEDPAVTPESNAGSFVETTGTVISTDPVVIEIETDGGGTDRLQLENAPSVAEGQIITVSGTLTEAGTLEVNPERAVVREPWEVAYMYLISLVGVLAVVGVGVDSWRFDLRTLSVEPREKPLHESYRERSKGSRNA